MAKIEFEEEGMENLKIGFVRPVKPRGGSEWWLGLVVAIIVKSGCGRSGVVGCENDAGCSGVCGGGTGSGSD